MAVQRMSHWTAVKYFNFFEYILQFCPGICIAVPEASSLGLEFAFLDALFLATSPAASS